MIDARPKVPLLDLTRQYAGMRDEILAEVARVFESQRFILGEQGAALELELAGTLGAAHAIGVSSGTDALLAALMALDVRAGDEVVVPAFSFFATAGVVARLGAVPVFADVEPGTLTSPRRISGRNSRRRRAPLSPCISTAVRRPRSILEIARSGHPRRGGRVPVSARYGTVRPGPSATRGRSPSFRRRTWEP
jgi:hypothetical protein